MKIAGRILKTGLALTMAFQTLPVCVSYADYESHEETKLKWCRNEITKDLKLYVECGSDEVEIPSEVNGNTVRELDLNFVMETGGNRDTVTLKLPESIEKVNKEWYKGSTGINKIRLVYASGETELREGKNVYWYEEGQKYNSEFSVINEGDDCCISIGTVHFHEAKIPEEIYGSKKVRIDLEHVYLSSHSPDVWCTDPAFVINVPEGAEIVNKHWKSAVTGIPVIRLVYSSGETEELKADDFDEMVEYAKNSEKFIDDYRDKINEYPLMISYVLKYHPDHKDMGYLLDERDRMKLIYGIYAVDGFPRIDYSPFLKSTSDVDLQDLILTEKGVYNYTITDYRNNNLMYLGTQYIMKADENIINEHWLAAENGLLDIELIYPSGEKKYLRADDYDKYMPGSDDFDKYNVIVMGRLYKYNTEYPDNVSTIAVKMDDFRKWSDYSNIDDITYTSEAFYYAQCEEYAFPVNKGSINIESGYSGAFSGSAIKTLIVPGNNVNLDEDCFDDSEIEKIVFQDDADVATSLMFDNSGIKEVTFEKSADIGRAAFWGCSGLSNINIGLSEKINGSAFGNCANLMNINGESPVNEDGSLKPEYEEFVSKNFNDATSIGFLDKYVSYRVKQAVSEAVTDDMPDIVKVKALHDKLCSMTSYDPGDITAAKNHVDVSVFLNDTTVCEGYARAMNLMLHESGIESCYVDTADHAWVIVKLGDHYFHVDPTWDDGDKVRYDWFMKSDSQIDGKDSHTNWELRCPSTMHSFQWKTMPQCTDIMGDVDDNDIIDGRDASAILTSYARTSVGGNEEVDSILADFNCDGIVDGRDASAVLTEYARSSVNN